MTLKEWAEKNPRIVFAIVQLLGEVCISLGGDEIRIRNEIKELKDHFKIEDKSDEPAERD